MSKAFNQISQSAVYREDEVSVSLTVCGGSYGGGSEVLVVYDCGFGSPIAFGISAYDSNSMRSSNPNSGMYKADTARTLDLNGGNPACNQGGIAIVQPQPIVLQNNQNNATVGKTGVCPTLPAAMGMGGGYVPMIVDKKTKTVCFGFDPGASRDVGVLFLKDVSKTISNGTCPGHHNGVVLRKDVGEMQDVTGPLMASGYSKLGTQEAANEMYVVQAWDGSQVSPTLTSNNAGGNQRMPDKGNFTAVVQTVKTKDNSGRVVTYAPEVGHALHGKANCMFREDAETYVAETVAAVDCRNGVENEKVNGTLQAKEQGQNLNSNNVCRNGSVVRRLTPLECERLQGYPDGWTLIGEPEEVEVKDYETVYDENGNEIGKELVGTHKEIEYFYTDRNGKRKRCADSARYKALGNSIALPFWQWMAKRISAQYERTPTMASLFDGIGGFPLVFSRAGAIPVWASEIEDFPIEVTRVRFAEEEDE